MRRYVRGLNRLDRDERVTGGERMMSTDSDKGGCE